MEPQNEIADPLDNQVCSNAFKHHWAEAQIDGPMQAIARYDDVAKLLITIGGFLLAVLAAGYSVMLRDLRGTMDLANARNRSKWIFASMLIFFVSAAAVCFPQPKMRAGKILEAKTDEDLTFHINEWCVNMVRVLVIKKVFLGIATASFIVSFLVLMSLLLSLFN